MRACYGLADVGFHALKADRGLLCWTPGVAEAKSNNTNVDETCLCRRRLTKKDSILLSSFAAPARKASAQRWYEIGRLHVSALAATTSIFRILACLGMAQWGSRTLSTLRFTSRSHQFGFAYCLRLTGYKKMLRLTGWSVSTYIHRIPGSMEATCLTAELSRGFE